MSEPLIDVIEEAAKPALSALPVLMSVAEVGQFLIDHGNIIKAIVEAFEGGSTEEQILAGIKGSMVVASDAVVEAELGPRPK